MAGKTPAQQRICDAAIIHFAETGYDGASLNEIAVMVGIRKASLYAHFNGKDALFLQAFRDATEIERTFARDLLAHPVPPEGPGAAYVAAIPDRYTTSVHLRMMLRTAFLSPAVLKHPIGAIYEPFLDALETGFLKQLGETATVDHEMFAKAYVGIVESLYVERTYGTLANTQVRQRALWAVFVDSLRTRRAETDL